MQNNDAIDHALGRINRTLLASLRTGTTELGGKYLRHIQLYGPECVLEGMANDRAQMTSGDVVAIIRAYVAAGGELATKQKAQVVRALTVFGWKQDAIAGLLKVDDRTVRRLVQPDKTALDRS